MITLQEAQERIAQEKKTIEELFTKFGYRYYGKFSEQPDISFWVKGEEGIHYSLQGRYRVPAPCIDIDEDFFWQYEDVEGNTSDRNSGTGADTLSEFLVDNQ